MDRSTIAAGTFLLLLVAAWKGVQAYSTGSPAGDQICTSMIPGHRDTSPQNGPSPFTLSPAQGGVARGEPLNITLTSRHGFSYKGFLIQARGEGSQKPIGTFILHDPSNSQVISCLGGVNNSATHSNPSLKTTTSFEWVPPADFNGNVVFNSTVVQDYSTFWPSVAARALVGEPALSGSTAGISTTQQPVTTERTSTTNEPVTRKPASIPRAEDPIYSGCGTSKACFGYPANCDSKSNCDFMVSIQIKNEKFLFEMMAHSVKYVTVGLSNNKLMDRDCVMECVLRDDGQVKLYQSWNKQPDPRQGNYRVAVNNDLNLITTSQTDGKIYCQFERNPVTTVEGVEFDLRNTKYYLLMAVGNSIKEGGDGGVGYHSDIRPIASDKSALLSDPTGFSLASKLLLRLHGAFMIGAWIGAASIGIVLARYFKQTWTGSQLCGKDQWFAWHRIFMVLVWCLTIAAFVLIFIELKAWSSADKHAILGVITTALAFFQPIGAIFRPSPDSSRRPIFNWVHWFFGNCAHIFGIVSIFLAGQLGKAELPKWWIWIMVGYVAFHVLMHLLFSIAGCVSERRNTKRINSIPMKEMSNSRTPLASADRRQEAPHACFRKFLLAVYIFGILVITIALIVIAALAPIEENVDQIMKYFANNSSG